MSTALEIKRGDVVSFTSHPRYFAAIKIVEEREVSFLSRDDHLTQLTFIINSISRQVMLPHDHPVEFCNKTQLPVQAQPF